MQLLLCRTFFMVFMWCGLSASLWAQTEAYYTLIIADAETTEPIVSATIRSGTQSVSTDTRGRALVPKSALTDAGLVITALGYKPLNISSREVHTHQSLHVHLRPNINALGEAEVVGLRTQHLQNAVTKTLDATDVQRYLGSNLATALQQVEGISMVQSGATVAKPMLHGMMGNRLLIVNNGVRQQGQQWGDDHAPEIDANNAGSIRVLKGADAVRFGSEALGGVIELESKPLPYGRHRSAGSLATMYGSNGRRSATTSMVDAGLALGHGEVAWRLQATYINAGDRSTPRYNLQNTALREANASAAVGWRQGRLTIDGFYSYFSTKLGVLPTAQMGDTTLFAERLKLGEPVEKTPWARSIAYPYHQISHHIARLRGHYQLAATSLLSWQYAYQSDVRDEYHLRRNNASSTPTLSLRLRTHQLDGKWQHAYATHWRTELGTFLALTNNFNVAGTGVVPLIPNYTQRNIGAYAIQKYAGNHWGAELGARADHQRLKAAGIDWASRPYGGIHSYTNLTANLGAHIHPTDSLALVSNLGIAFRTPHVYELYSNGIEHGAGFFARGDASLQPEVSTKWITTLRYATPRLTASLDAYVQWINNYIYDEPNGKYWRFFSGVYPIFQYRSADALFRGIDLHIGWQALTRLRYDVSAAALWANERSSGRYLPYIPSHRLKHSLVWKAGDWAVAHDVTLSLTHQFVAKQTRFDAATDLVNTSPAAYHLLHAQLSAHFAIGHTTLHATLSADNLLNTLYREYTNRFRYFAHDQGRDLRLMLSWAF
ncbi:MAG: TonB-dependent receptor [Bacteroidales bacterium]|nr:TonB-dependent receptor [Bacteroidales bacterium]